MLVNELAAGHGKRWPANGCDAADWRGRGSLEPQVLEEDPTSPDNLPPDQSRERAAQARASSSGCSQSRAPARQTELLASGAALFVALISVAVAVLTWALVHGRCGRSSTSPGAASCPTGGTGEAAVHVRSPLAGEALVGVVLLIVVVTPAVGQEVVLDPTNLVQNTISALKTVESVINEVPMIANQVKQIQELIQNARTTRRGSGTERRFPAAAPRADNRARAGHRLRDGRRRSPVPRAVPGYRPITDWAASTIVGRARRWTPSGAASTPCASMARTSRMSRRESTVTALSDTAEGRMQAIQTGNMIAAEQVQQLVKLRQLMMAQINAQNVYMADQTNREAQRAATQREWIRNGNREAPGLESSSTTRPASGDRLGHETLRCPPGARLVFEPGRRRSRYVCRGLESLAIRRFAEVSQRLLGRPRRRSRIRCGRRPRPTAACRTTGPAELPDRGGGRCHGPDPRRAPGR